MSKIDELRELVEAVGRLVGELAGVELTGEQADAVQQFAADLFDYAGMVDEVAVCARGLVSSVMWADGVVYEWGAGDVLIDRRAGTVEDAERVAASHGVLLEVL